MNKKPSNDFIVCHAILGTLHTALLNTEDWNTLRKEGVLECLKQAQNAIRHGYDKALLKKEKS